MDWNGARSTLPGRVSLDALTLRIRDSNMELQAVLEGVEIRFSIRDLLRRRFHATRVRVGRVTFRLRELMKNEDATPARLANYPQIEGWPGPPVLGEFPPIPPEEDPWRIVVDGLTIARLEEIWIDSCRWTGNGRVEGSFEVFPGQRARIGPARLEVATGEVRRGDAIVVARTTGSVRCEIPSFDTKVFTGNDVWKLMSGGASLSGSFGGPAFLGAEVGGARFSGGEGAIRVQVDLKDGSGTAVVRLTSRDVKARTATKTIRGTVVADVRVSGVDFKKGEASLAGTSVVLSDVAVADSGKIDAWAATFHARTGRFNLDDGSVDARMEGRIRDARPIVALMPPGLAKWAAGLLHLEDLEARCHITAAPSRFAIEALTVSSGNFSLDGYYRETGAVGRGRLHVKKGIFSVRFPI